MLSALPVDAAAFAAAMARFSDGDGHLAVAVSGGPDSTALAFLAARWARARGKRLFAFTVDHRLRPDSGREAAQTAARMAALGLPHRILVWDDAPARASQEAARRARYALLVGACREAGCDRLLLGHSRDDQAETVLWRLARGSGPDGLAGMPAERLEDGIRLLRPLLDFPKARLVATCDAAGLAFVTDPSNAAPRYARGRLRATRAALAEEGMTDTHLVRLAARMAMMRDALDGAARAFAVSAIRSTPYGEARLDRAAFAAAEPEIARRALALALRRVGGRARPPAFEALLCAVDRIAGRGGEPVRTAWTLGGCVCRMAGAEAVLRREPRGLEERPVTGGEEVVWDGRFRVSLPPGLPPESRLSAWGAAAAGSWRPPGLAAGTARVLPALWTAGRLVLPPVASSGPVLDWQPVE